MDGARGELGDGHVTVPAGRGASALHSKGSHGTPRSGGALGLTLVEAAYLVETARLTVADGQRDLTLEDVLALGSSQDDRFELRYLVYRDFRERGYAVHEEGGMAKIDFTVRARGASPKSPSKFWVLAVSERSEFRAAEILAYATRAQALDKTPLVAVVDEEGDLTYYEFEPGLKGGKVAGRPKGIAMGFLSGNHVIVVGDEVRELHAEDEMLGKPLKHLLRLSLIEAAYLAEQGRLDVEEGRKGGRGVSAAALVKHASEHQQDFALRLAAYRALKESGLVPKTGFKYGSHFRVYDREGGSSHARYLVHAIPETFASSWPELSRAVRLSHGVKKRLVYALSSDAEHVRFMRVKWTRP